MFFENCSDSSSSYNKIFKIRDMWKNCIYMYESIGAHKSIKSLQIWIGEKFPCEGVLMLFEVFITFKMSYVSVKIVFVLTLVARWR